MLVVCQQQALARVRGPCHGRPCAPSCHWLMEEAAWGHPASVGRAGWPPAGWGRHVPGPGHWQRQPTPTGTGLGTVAQAPTHAGSRPPNVSGPALVPACGSSSGTLWTPGCTGTVDDHQGDSEAVPKRFRRRRRVLSPQFTDSEKNEQTPQITHHLLQVQVQDVKVEPATGTGYGAPDPAAPVPTDASSGPEGVGM